MPVHDWTRVTAGTFHAFHNSWITHIQESLNAGLLPDGYYALGEQRSGDIGPDVPTLHAEPEPDRWQEALLPDDNGMIAVAEHPPQVSMTLEAATDAAFYIAKRRTIVIYHSAGDRIVALMEIVSAGNKHSRLTIDPFVDKLGAALHDGYHVLLVDLFPPGRHDSDGIHGILWEYITNEPWQMPPDRPLALASYCAKQPIAAYVEPIRVGRELPDMPLFLTPGHYINVPLEGTYLAAWRGVPDAGAA